MAELPDSPLVGALTAVAVDGSVRPDDTARTGVHRLLEATPDRLVAVAAVYRGAGYFLESLAAVDREDFRELYYTFNRLGNAPDRHLLRVQVDADEAPTISHLFAAADWFEREAHEMMGVRFDGHPNLQRLLLPEDADFFPLRRDQCIDEALRDKREKDRQKREAAAKKAAAKAAAEEAAREAAAKAAEEAPTEEAAAVPEGTEA